MNSRKGARVSGRAVLGALVVLGLSACGLEQVATLLAQPQKLSPGPQYFQFRKTSTNGDPVQEPDFLGFELYYKIYDPGDDSTINADRAAIAVYDDLSKRSFRRIHASQDRVGSIVKPLIRIHPSDRSAEFPVTISFVDDPTITDGATPALNVPILVQDIRRGVNYTEVGLSNQFKRFADFKENDGDISYNPAIWNNYIIAGPSPVALMLYVVSYGRDVLDDRQLYSQPLELGEIRVTFTPQTF